MIKFFLTIRSILVFQFFLLCAAGHHAHATLGERGEVEVTPTNPSRSGSRSGSSPTEGPKGSLKKLKVTEAVTLASKAIGAREGENLDKIANITSVLVIIERKSIETGKMQYLWITRAKQETKANLFPGEACISGRPTEEDMDDLETTVKREAHEEIGITLNELELVCIWQKALPLIHGLGLPSIQVCYYAREGTWNDAQGVKGGDTFNLKKNEVEAYKWLSMRDVLNRKSSKNYPYYFSTLGHEEIFVEEFIFKFKKNELKREREQKRQERKVKKEANKEATALKAENKTLNETLLAIIEAKCSPHLNIHFISGGEKETPLLPGAEVNSSFVPRLMDSATFTTYGSKNATPANSPPKDVLSGKNSPSDSSPGNGSERPSLGSSVKENMARLEGNNFSRNSPCTNSDCSDSESDVENEIQEILETFGEVSIRDASSLDASMDFQMEDVLAK